MGTSVLAGDATTMSKGMAAPAENITADVSAACTGRAVVISEISSSSRAWAVIRSAWAGCHKQIGKVLAPRLELGEWKIGSRDRFAFQFIVLGTAVTLAPPGK
jgi:hypothetical protein